MFHKSKDKKERNNVEDDIPKDDQNSSRTLRSTRTFYIVPHSGLTKVIRVLDLTGSTKSAFPSEDFKNEVKEIAKISPPEPWLTITRTPHWYSKTFIIEKPGQMGGQIAEWKGGFWSSSSNTFTFPEGSSHSSHTIKMEADSSWKFREQFVKDSVPYQWKPDNAFSNTRSFTMYKLFGGQKHEIGRYMQGWQLKYGGIMVLDDTEIDDVVAVLSMVNILRKKRQKDAEYSGGGGGG